MQLRVDTHKYFKIQLIKGRIEDDRMDKKEGDQIRVWPRIDFVCVSV